MENNYCVCKYCCQWKKKEKKFAPRQLPGPLSFHIYFHFLSRFLHISWETEGVTLCMLWAFSAGRRVQREDMEIYLNAWSYWDEKIRCMYFFMHTYQHSAIFLVFLSLKQYHTARLGFCCTTCIRSCSSGKESHSC